MEQFRHEHFQTDQENPLLMQLRSEFQDSYKIFGDRKVFRIVKKMYPTFISDVSLSVRDDSVQKRLGLVTRIYQRVGALPWSSKEEQNAILAMGRLTGSLLQLTRVPSELNTLQDRVRELENLQFIDDEENMEVNETIESHMNAYLLHSKEVGHGKQGVVFYMDLEQEDERFRQALIHEGVPVDATESAVKVLKIENVQAIEIEYKRQLRAYEVINQARKSNVSEGISIPRPYLFKGLKIAPEVSERLSHYQCNLPSNTADVLMMDYIPGKDIEYFLFREALTQKGVEVEDSIDSQSLYHQAMVQFDFEMVGSSRNPQEQAVIRRNNMLKILHFLKQRGVNVNPGIIKRMKSGLRILHDANVWHGDLHEKNIMFTGTNAEFFSQSENVKGEVFFIDFGPEDEELSSPEKDFIVPNRLSELNR